MKYLNFFLAGLLLAVCLTSAVSQTNTTAETNVFGAVSRIFTYASREVQSDLTISNGGARVLTGMHFNFSLPDKWILVSTTPEYLDLKPGQSALIQFIIAVPASQAAGNYSFVVQSITADYTSPKWKVDVTVRSNPIILLWAALVLTAAGLGTWLFFRKAGRR